MSEVKTYQEDECQNFYSVTSVGAGTCYLVSLRLFAENLDFVADRLCLHRYLSSAQYLQLCLLLSSLTSIVQFTGSADGSLLQPEHCGGSSFAAVHCVFFSLLLLFFTSLCCSQSPL